MNPQQVVRRKTYEDTHGSAPPSLIHLDHAHADVVLAVLLDNRLAKRKFDGGYVHNGQLNVMS